ncbi:MATE family efflux transporter [Methylobrevis albus]|uniref:MATE family efflux transporter n=1 Tax=Methylobrevis albus TaxID=2793297 RepID=A0A931MZ58_9HYPH|nr:MATE family efflux transporter [Methylobrevis albus]MBH0237416.1 MATE family efflux transporter [Methylobrevis albus]
MTVPTTAPQDPGFVVDSRAVFRIALPMTLAFITTPLLGAVDIAVIGQVGDAAMIGGIAVGALVFDVLFSTFNFLRSGTTGLTAQALGARDEVEQKAVLLRAILIAVVAGLAMIAASALIIAGSLWVVAPSAAVAAATQEYFDVRILAAPVTLLNYAVLGWIIGRGKAGIGLGLQLVVNGVNIAGSIAFGLWLGWGLFGVALGTVLGETVGAVAGLIVCWREGRGTPWPAYARVAERVSLLRMLGVNRDIMIRTFALLAAFVVFTRAGAGNGDTVLAANAILMNFFLIGGYFLDGLATAAEQMVGRAVGARHRPSLIAAIRLTTLWSFLFAAAAGLFFLVAGGAIVDVMAQAPDVRAEARAYLAWAALTPLAGVLAFQMDGVFIGATWSREMRNMMLLSLAAYLAVLALTEPYLGNHGLWASINAFLFFRGGFLLWRLPGQIAKTFPPPHAAGA